MAHKISKGLVIGLVAAGAAAALYAFTGERGKHNRKKVAMWVKQMEADALEKLKAMKEVSKEKYDDMIDRVSARYQALRHLDPQEVALAAAQLKRHWKAIKRDIESAVEANAPVAKSKRKKKPVK